LSGLVGICTSRDPALGCPQPDLTLALPANFKPRFEYHLFSEEDCLLQKCVSGPGPRRLLRFPLDVVNRGEGHMIIALRDAPGVRRVACDGSVFLDDFLRYELIDAEGARRARGSGSVSVACRVDEFAQSTSPFDCEVLGLEAHSFRAYASDAECQWVDVTTLPAGAYTLRLSVNADSSLAEQDFGNNVLEREVIIADPNPLAPCENGEMPGESSFGEDVECGWEIMPGQTGLACVPGEPLTLGCTFCNGAYMPRVCPGVEPCSGAGLARIYGIGMGPVPCSREHSCEGFGQCTQFDFDCPTSGMYTLLGFPMAPFLPTGSAPASAPSDLICQRGGGEGLTSVGSGFDVEPAFGTDSGNGPGDAGSAEP
jgi:hypothetical protein